MPENDEGQKRRRRGALLAQRIESRRVVVAESTRKSDERRDREEFQFHHLAPKTASRSLVAPEI